MTVCKNEILNKVEKGLKSTYPRSCPICKLGPCQKNVKVLGKSAVWATDLVTDKKEYSTILQIAKIINGPRQEVPEGEKYTLADLQELTWNRLTTQEKNHTTMIAKAVFTFVKEEWLNSIEEKII